MPRKAGHHAIAILFLLLATGASAIDTTIGDWQISLDTTLSSGFLVRTSPIDKRFVGGVNGGYAPAPNADDGTLNYRNGSLVGAPTRITSELQVQQLDYGLFIRGTGFYDAVVDGSRTDFHPLSRAAVRDIGADLRLLDGYGFARPTLFGHPIDVRIGAQTLNWGESSFIVFGIDSITPFDATALHSPGAELRTALLSVPAIDLKTEIIRGVSIEGFWQFAWTRTKLDPVGSFFSTADTVFDGGRYAVLRSDLPDAYSSIFKTNALAGNPFGGGLPRRQDRHPTSLDQFGVALRISLPALHDAEFGVYFENYHSRTPFGSEQAGSLAALRTNEASLLGTPKVTFSSSSPFFADYPQDIRLLGLSWNFSGPAGFAIQGEISHRFDQPLQLATSDLQLINQSPGLCQAAIDFAQIPFIAAQFGAACAAARRDPVAHAIGGLPGFGQSFAGWKRYPVTQAQMTLTRLYGAIPSLGVSSTTFVGEVAADYISNFPKQRGVLNAFYSTDGNSAFEILATPNGSGKLTTKGLASQFAAAYVIAAIVDMPNVLPAGIDMQPNISWQHDFAGTSPIGANLFQENTASASVGVTLNYLSAWRLAIQYTTHFPIFAPGKYYGLIDRDFASMGLSYEF